MKTQMLKLTPLLFIFLWSFCGFGQTITTTAGSLTSCPGEIVIPVTVTNCNGLGAISLMLNYNDAILTYSGYQNLHAALTTGLLIVHSTGSKVVVSWANTTPANVGNNTLLELKFNAIPWSAALTWDTQTPGNCEYSDINGNILPATYVNGTATIQQPPLITTQPVDKSVLVGQNSTFSLTAIATGISYQWQLSTNGGATYVDLVNSGAYSGVTTANLGISNITLGMNGYKFRCFIEGVCPPEVYSNAVLLNVINPLTTTLPTVNICPGNTTVPLAITNFTEVAAFSLVFSYNPSLLDYDGYQNLNPALSGGSVVVNAMNGKVYLSWASATAVTIGDGNIAEIKFIASAGTGSLTWNVQTEGDCEYSDINGNPIVSVFFNGNLQTYGLPTVLTHPVDKIVAKGQSTTFGITASGSGLTYQWQLSTDGGSSFSDLSNGGNYSNVTTTTMTVSNVQLTMSSYLYRCLVTGTCSPVAFSYPALLTVLPNISTTCQTVSTCPGAFTVAVNVTDFIGVGAFSMALNYNSSILTYTGYQNLNSNLNGGTFAANAANGKVFLTWSRTTPATIPNGAVMVEIKFTGVPGTSPLTWDIQTPGSCEYSDINGLIIFSSWVNGNATVYSPPAIAAQPVDKSIYSGGSTSFSVSATGTGLGYLWQVSTDGGSGWTNLSNSSPYSGVTTATLTINPASQGMNGYLYRCYVSGTCTPYVHSNAALLTVTAPAIYTTAGGITNSCSGNLTIPVSVVNCNNVGSISLALNYDPVKLTFEGYHSLHSGLSGGMLIINNTGNRIMLSWASTNPLNVGNGILVKLDFTGNAAISTTLTWDMQTPGNCEYSDVSGNIFTSFFNNGSVTIAANALIANAGPDVAINPGDNTQLNCSSTGGTSPYDYLWTPDTWLNDPEIANPVSTPANTVTYTVHVTDVLGCVASDKVTVTVDAPLISLNLKVMLEGAYSGTGMSTLLNSNNLIPLEQPYGLAPWFYTGTESVPSIPNTNVTDWVLVELRQTSGGASTATSGTRIAQKPAFLLKTGTITDLDGASVLQMNANVSQNLYVVIWHRNHLVIMSANPVTTTGGVYTYDFSNSSTKAYGGTLAQKQILTGVWCMVAGNGNGDKWVNAGDKLNSWAPAVGKKGYLAGDFDLNTQVNNLDKNDLWLLNTTYVSQVPD
jgi:hypothetical protein